MTFDEQNLNSPGHVNDTSVQNKPLDVPDTHAVERPKKHLGWRIFWGIVITLSLIANLILLMAIIGFAAMFGGTEQGTYVEEIIHGGPGSNKISIITLQGIITAEQSEDINRQIKLAEKDKRVKGLVLKVNSPGGTVSASDEIYNYIRSYRERTGKPVVAFMAGMAASGGYYSSVACNKIIAEPTTITGSIGVIMSYFVFQDLLEGKLGVIPVTVKAGAKKNWPDPFQKPSDEQITYLQERMVGPAFERFKLVVAEGRKGILAPEDVNRIADGSIYNAQRALEEKLIDKIGYREEAIEEVKRLADIKEAEVIEYKKPFSLSNFLLTESRSSIFKLDKTMLYGFSTPEVLYLWNGR